ncbi:MAG: PEP-CTERM sorting domain-containing protein [Candidatus Omnitrophota bacterium]
MARKMVLALMVLLVSFFLPAAARAVNLPFINEFHYDNAGTDVGEAIEIAGPAGFDLVGWSVVLYNGADGKKYNTLALNGAIPNLQNGFGALAFAVAGIQNGAPDGMALVDSSLLVSQFLSYEGAFAAIVGPAAGMASTNIGVLETAEAPAGASLQLAGAGRQYSDFIWTSALTNTFGAVNANQTFTGAAVPEPMTFLLLGLGGCALSLTCKQRI